MHIPFPLSIAGQAAARLYTSCAGARPWLYRNGWRRQIRLRARVISIGNIAWGGTGKTPFTIWLAERLTSSGVNPSILTRGYGRSSRHSILVLPPGARPQAALDAGDEVQLYLRHNASGPVGIAASRFQAGRAVEEQFPVDVHLLDDGFQHLQLARDMDIVLIDARNPWGSRWGIPRVLREHPSSLRRADILLLTNADFTAPQAVSQLAALEADLERLHPAALRVHCSNRIIGFLAHKGEASASITEMQGLRVLAFCGLASPANFFAALVAAGIPLVARRSFRDHHRYSADDLRELEQLARSYRADCLVTTEKDLVNLPDRINCPVPIYWTKTQFSVNEGARLLGRIAERLGDNRFSRLMDHTGPGATPADPRAAVRTS